MALNIIIAEDERIIALSLSAMLKRMGHSVLDLCPSAERCLEAVPKHNPDLVLMDIRMEGEMDGIEAAGILKEKYQTPVIFTTAFDDKDTRRRAADVKPLGFLVKPIVRSDIENLLSTLV